LLSMQERIKMMKGKFVLENRKNEKGIKISIRFNL
jgi:signal transduction histidine kinase